MDVTIVGSGIIGLLTAKALVDAGLSVQIIERNSGSFESSWAGGGILLPLYPWQQKKAISELVSLSLSLYPQLSAKLIEATNINPEWWQCGLLISQNSDIETATQWCETYKIKHSLAPKNLFKAFNTQPLNPLWLPEIAQARNPRLLKSLRAFLGKHNKVEFVENCSFNEIILNKKCVTKIKTSSGQFSVNQLLLATGAWTGQLTQQLFPDDKPIAVHPVKGQMILLDANVGDLSFMILDQRRYLIPRADGKILAGSTVEQTEFDKSVTDDGRESLHEFALELMPALKKAPLLHHWAGLRPATKQGVPYIDRHPEIQNLTINAGHFRNGLVMAPASAQLMTDLILDRPPSLDPQPYQLTRTD